MQTDYEGNGQASTNAEEDAYSRMIHLVSGSATEEERDEFLRYTADNTLSAQEITGFSRAIRSRSSLSPVPGLMDIVGTGGDGKNTVNVSTASAIAASSLGIRVAKHGNRAITSRHGSADFMRFLGYDLEFGKDQTLMRLNRSNFIYLLAPHFNTAFSTFSEARKRIGRRTVFNIMGPITNPLDPDFMILGSYNLDTAEIYSQVLSIGSKTGACFSSESGMDEISPDGRTRIYYVRDGRISKSMINGESVTGERADIAEITEPDPVKCFQKTLDGLYGRNLHVSRFIALNTAPALVVKNLARNLEDAYEMVMQAITSGIVADHAKRIVE